MPLLCVAILVMLNGCAEIERVRRNVLGYDSDEYIRSDGDVIAYEIDEHIANGRYDDAYRTIKRWSENPEEINNLFLNAKTTAIALSLAARHCNMHLYNVIIEHNNKPSEAIDAFKSVEKDSMYVCGYYNCFYKNVPPTVNGCEEQLADLQKVDQRYAHFWNKSPLAKSLYWRTAAPDANLGEPAATYQRPANL